MNRNRAVFRIIAVAVILTFLFSDSISMAQQQLVAPRIVILKKARKLKLYEGRKLVKTYPIVLGSAPVGDKQIEGDGRTPEGDFYVFVKNDKSKFTLSLGLSYPSVDDAERGLKSGLISDAEERDIKAAINSGTMPLQKTKLGGEIYIHGGGTKSDWTDGCIALDDNDIRELFSLANTGMPVTIRP